MKEISETTPTERKSFGLASFLIWGIVLVFAYVLSMGPVLKLADKGFLNNRLGNYAEIMYAPVIWAQEETFLRKPLGWYFHLWSRRFDRNGNRD